ncbi:MAG: glycosyltransferase family 4 protein [Anaerolineae bacterium]
MRIGIDARLTHYRAAGISRYTLQLIKALARLQSGDAFTILQSYHTKQPLVTEDRFETRRVLTPSHHRLEQLTLPLEVSLLKLDLLHSPDFIPPFRAKCRSVITIHDLNFMLYPHFMTKESARYYGQIDEAVRRSDAIIAVSNATKRDTVRLLGVDEKRITVIYEAASSYFQPMDRAEARRRIAQRFDIGPDFILFVSTIEPRKNIPNLVRAYRLLLDEYHSDATLVLAGAKGWLFEDVFQLVRELGLEDRVRFLGRVATEELLWLYNAARVLVAPSFYEGFGLTPLEAMACGTPVVVSDVSSLPEIVADAGLTAPPDDPEAIAAAVWRVLDDNGLWDSLAAKGLKRAACFSWDKAAEQTLALYHSVA